MKNGKLIALSALSTALCTMLLIFGAYFSTFDLSCLFMASLAVMLPLCKKSYKGAILTYFASLLLALIFASSNFTVVVCFAVFFGLHPIVNYFLISKNVKPISLFTILKVIWFVGLMFIMYFLLNMFVDIPEIIKPYIVYCLILCGIIVGFIYDLCLIRFQIMAIRIIERLKL